MNTHRTKLYGVLAYPAGENLFHEMLARAAEVSEAEASFLLFNFQPKDIADPIEALRRLKAGGAYLTGRLRESAGGLVDYLSDEAHGSGMINTITIDGEAATGHNTEATALISLLEPFSERFVRRSAVILGSGVMARGVAYALIRHFRVRHVAIAARDPQHAQLLKQANLGLKNESTIEACELFPPDITDLLVEARLIVNATPLGSSKALGETPITLPDIFQPGQIVVDVNYDPVQTRLLEEASAAGATTIDGRQLLERQIRNAFELLTGKPYPEEVDSGEEEKSHERVR